MASNYFCSIVVTSLSAMTFVLAVQILKLQYVNEENSRFWFAES